MPTPDFDFVLRRQSLSPPAVLLLAGAVLLVLAAGWRLNVLQQRSARLAAQAAQLRPALPAQVHSSEETALAEKLAYQFKRPWNALFAHLEAIQVKGIQLHQILPQTGTAATVQIAGEAQTPDAMYDYLRRLRGNGPFQDAHLIAQSRDEQQSGIRFQLRASWPSGQAPETTP